jgi:diaminopimelate epimerase
MQTFFKYQATGNDFILIDNREQKFNTADTELVKNLCDRHFGIGADGLILLEDHSDLDFKMVYFNSDGRQSSMCGNGGRCITMFAKHLKIIDSEAEFLAVDGYHYAKIKQDLVWLKMTEPMDIEQSEHHFYLNTGSPHWVEFKQNLDFEDETFVKAAKAIRYNERFANVGTNVNFVSISDNKNLKIRTYERGCEVETLSCGTGVVAAALCASFEGLHSPVWAQTKGGILSVHFTKSGNDFEDVYLVGPAKLIFSGQIEI